METRAAPVKLLRFADLRDAGIVTSWPQLRRLQEKHGFPAGFKISEHSRVWDLAEIEAFLESRREASAGARQREAA